MKTPQILTGQQAIDQFGLNALIECRVAITTELNGLGHSVMQIGFIEDPDNCFIDLSDEPAVLYVEIEQDDDWILHPIMADEQFVLLDDKNQPAKTYGAKTPEQIYLIPDAEHGQVWCDTPAPGEGMREEDATRYVREDLVPASNEVLARRIVELTNERDAALAQLVEVQNNCTGVSPCERFCEALATKRMFDNLQSDNRQLKAQVEQLNNELRQQKLIHIGFTNESQVRFATEDKTEAMFYPDSDNECYIPVYMLDIHAHRVGYESVIYCENMRMKQELRELRQQAKAGE